MMSYKDAKAAIHAAPIIFIWCNITWDEGCYFQITKSEALAKIVEFERNNPETDASTNAGIRFRVNTDSDKSVFIA
jgi:hypothetical protein